MSYRQICYPVPLPGVLSIRSNEAQMGTPTALPVLRLRSWSHCRTRNGDKRPSSVLPRRDFDKSWENRVLEGFLDNALLIVYKGAIKVGAPAYSDGKITLYRSSVITHLSSISLTHRFSVAETYQGGRVRSFHAYAIVVPFLLYLKPRNQCCRVEMSAITPEKKTQSY